MLPFELGEVIYSNPLARERDVDGFIMEGDGTVTFPMGRMRLESLRDPAEGQKSNVVYWCPVDLPADISISWDFFPLREPGLAILFFAARGREGQDIFDPGLPSREGIYGQYHSGSINALHVSYFRRRWEPERRFHLCNLRKSHGFHLVCQGPDPLPPVPDARPPYRLSLIKSGPDVYFLIDDLEIFHWTDDGKTYGPILGGGKIGFRQMAPLIAEYANLEVRAVKRL